MLSVKHKLKLSSMSRNKDTSKPTPTHLDWSVESRVLNQRASVKLYKLISSAQCWSRSDLGYDAKTLISIGFSLWRAAFLADKSGFRKDTNRDATWFLGEMLETNAIAFVQDKKAKNFTFNYYLANVRFRLAEYKADHRTFNVDERLLEKGKAPKDPRTRWRAYQAAFGNAVDHFERRLKAARISN